MGAHLFYTITPTHLGKFAGLVHYNQNGKVMVHSNVSVSRNGINNWAQKKIATILVMEIQKICNHRQKIINDHGGYKSGALIAALTKCQKLTSLYKSHKLIAVCRIIEKNSDCLWQLLPGKTSIYYQSVGSTIQNIINTSKYYINESNSASQRVSRSEAGGLKVDNVLLPTNSNSRSPRHGQNHERKR